MPYRSRLEERVARWLELNEFDYAYEPIRLPYVLESTYCPDFVLPNGVHLEVKGFLKPEDRRKMKAVKAQHPDIDIRFVFQSPFNTISKTSKTTYAAWAEKAGFPWCRADTIPLEWFDENPPTS